MFLKEGAKDRIDHFPIFLRRPFWSGANIVREPILVGNQYWSGIWRIRPKKTIAIFFVGLGFFESKRPKTGQGSGNPHPAHISPLPAKSFVWTQPAHHHQKPSLQSP
jgi:hypothetical protein